MEEEILRKNVDTFLIYLPIAQKDSNVYLMAAPFFKLSK